MTREELVEPLLVEEMRTLSETSEVYANIFADAANELDRQADDILAARRLLGLLWGATKYETLNREIVAWMSRTSHYEGNVTR